MESFDMVSSFFLRLLHICLLAASGLRIQLLIILSNFAKSRSTLYIFPTLSLLPWGLWYLYLWDRKKELNSFITTLSSLYFKNLQFLWGVDSSLWVIPSKTWAFSFINQKDWCFTCVRQYFWFFCPPKWVPTWPLPFFPKSITAIWSCFHILITLSLSLALI